MPNEETEDWFSTGDEAADEERDRADHAEPEEACQRDGGEPQPKQASADLADLAADLVHGISAPGAFGGETAPGEKTLVSFSASWGAV